MFEKLLRNWMESKNVEEFNITCAFGEPFEISDEDGLYYVEELFFYEDEKELWAWCMDVDGETFEKPCIVLPNEMELTITNWLTNNA